MKIDIELNSKSIKNAIKIIKNQKKIIAEQMIPEYLRRSAEWIKNRANEILNQSDIGVEIAQNISSSWYIENISNNRIKLFNVSWKSAYVEFGVGIVGANQPHPNASNTNYEYNVETQYKNLDGSWVFSVADHSELDIPRDAIIDQFYGVDSKGSTLTILTKGTKGVWYLFNAVEDFKLQEKNRLWEEIKKKYWS